MAERIVVKVGSNIVAREDGFPDEERIADLARQVSALKKLGKEVVLVSSGAVAAGRGLIPQKDLPKDPVSKRQLLASLGQVRLVQLYNQHFSSHGQLASQVLVTRSDFRDRSHYLNIRNCFETLLAKDVVPIVNENDVVSVTELMFTDNDQLAGLIAAMVNAGQLYLLSNVPGLLDRSPQDPNAKVLPIWEGGVNGLANLIVQSKSSFGRGGMLTKCRNAIYTARLGISVTIANGSAPDILLKLANGEAGGTNFPAQPGPSGLKKWIAHSDGYAKGKVWINQGAENALLSEKATSLLPVGIMKVEGDFRKGDMVSILKEDGQGLAVGIANYGSATAEKLTGKKEQRPFVHYDYLYIF